MEKVVTLLLLARTEFNPRLPAEICRKKVYNGGETALKNKDNIDRKGEELNYDTTDTGSSKTPKR